MAIIICVIIMKCINNNSNGCNNGNELMKIIIM
jgi:hypothetical protein